MLFKGIRKTYRTFRSREKGLRGQGRKNCSKNRNLNRNDFAKISGGLWSDAREKLWR